MIVFVKNTFLEVTAARSEDIVSTDRQPRYRAVSAPPPVVGASHTYLGDDQGVAAQLARLGAILRADASAGPHSSYEKATDTAKLSSCGSTTVAGSPIGRTSPEHDPDQGIAEDAHLEATGPTGDGAQDVAQPDQDGEEQWSEADIELVPLDGSGALTSMGSVDHPTSCRPCAFVRSSQGCKFGIQCKFCHFVAGHQESVRMRPCKGKRDRLKKSMALLEQRIAEDPALMDSGSFKLPAYVGSDPRSHARIMDRLSHIAARSLLRSAA